MTDALQTRMHGIFPHRTTAFCKATTGVVGTVLMAGLLLTLLLALVAPQSLRAAGAAPSGADPTTSAAGATTGLFFRAQDGGTTLLEAPLLNSDVVIQVHGQVARAQVRQRFHNPTDLWLEGVYVFPLPDSAAVDRQTMTVGERRIDGEIMERQAARRAYEAAAEAGQRASLLEGERPNVFVTSVANIGPGEAITIEIEYQEHLAYRDGRFALRFPMVVAPRYTPDGLAVVKGPGRAVDEPPKAQPIADRGAGEAGEQADIEGRGDSKTSEQADIAGRDLFGPVRNPADGATNPLSLLVRLDAGLPLAQIESLHHAVDIEAVSDRQNLITLADGPVPANRDFVLEWRPEIGSAPAAALFAEEIAGETYLLVSLLPPDKTQTADVTPRDLVLVIDTSGSMHGDSLEQAKAAVMTTLARLGETDRFNVIRFDDVTRALFPSVMPATRASIDKALAYVAGLGADGGTEMRPALELALQEPAETGRLRQVVFLTDGAVGNEAELFTVIARQLGATRLFTVGLGSAPNSYFMRKAAEMGRRGFTHIGKLAEVAATMTDLFAKLEQPALTDIDAVWNVGADVGVEAYPAPLPDLYAGDPVVFAARLPGVPLADLTGEIRLAGHVGETGWAQTLSLTGIDSAPGVAALWARAKIDRIEDGLYEGRDAEAVRQDTVAVALRHQLVTRHTSLVAIDDTVARPDDAGLASTGVPRDLPEGWDYDTVFGAAAEQMNLRMMPAPAMLQTAAAHGQPITLPSTATSAPLQALIGIGLVFCGLLVLLVLRRLRHDPWSYGDQG